MLNRLFNNPTQIAIEYALDATSARAHLIANNIANADTPGYKALRLNFEDILEQKLDDSGVASIGLKQTDPRHLPGKVFHGLKGTPTPYGIVYSDDRTTYRLDNNNVDIDREMAEQARNAIEYSTLTELAGRRLSQLRTVISEGRR
ncbi:MAG: flagellar basal body rod protein FlgB [bacterium]|nr:flagellar basal body rod protein FlgB [bacterium]